MAHNLEHELQQQVESTTSETGEQYGRRRQRGLEKIAPGKWWGTYDPASAGYADALAGVEAKRKRDYGGVFRMFGEEDMFTKITQGMRDAGDKETYKPFFETKRQGAESATLNQMKQAGYTKGGQARGFADSSARGSLMDDIMSGYGTKVVDYIGEMESSAAAGQRRLEEIIRNNQSQSQYLQELERG